ncbi:membrane protein [Novosphingobium indicum]|uniref:Membrane protein n=1 Tax=Novosphingobium indicum TaxID=462949 RepID=A0ABQ2JJ32_9SPHN|nr:MAPEG family protein [Novosphingobium indicum]GGN47823.1 membrane protein [Novosphingobium indicum]
MTVGMAILQPVVALAAWTMVMWFWLYGTRIPAMSAAKVDPEELAEDPSISLDNLLPPQVQWKAHNYNHLHEAPTVFYAVAIVLAIIGQGDGLNAQVGWAYVGFRVAHSLVQATINKLNLRFGLFALSTFCLMFLVARAAMALF